MDEFDNINAEKYLEFLLGEGIFATKLTEVREVIEYRPPKPVPHTAPFFKGVINLRGEIIGVVDLRQRLEMKSAETPLAMLVFDTDYGPLAALVDKVTSVTVIPDAQLEKRTTQQGADVERAYFIGIGRADDRLLTVITLKTILSKEQMAEAQP